MIPFLRENIARLDVTNRRKHITIDVSYFPSSRYKDVHAYASTTAHVNHPMAVTPSLPLKMPPPHQDVITHGNEHDKEDDVDVDDLYAPSGNTDDGNPLHQTTRTSSHHHHRRHYHRRRRQELVESDPLDLRSCLAKFTEKEQLGEKDTWYCPQCKQHVRAYKKFDLFSLPRILLIHLKRFRYAQSSYLMHRDKINTLVTFPIEGTQRTSTCSILLLLLLLIIILIIILILLILILINDIKLLLIIIIILIIILILLIIIFLLILSYSLDVSSSIDRSIDRSLPISPLVWLSTKNQSMNAFQSCVSIVLCVLWSYVIDTL